MTASYTASPATMSSVLRNTYALLGLSMVPTVLGAWFGMTSGWLGFSMMHPWLSALGSLAVMFVLIALIQKTADQALGVVLLLGFTGVMGVMLSSVLASALRFENGGALIGLAFGGTALIFASLATVATVSRRPFAGLGAWAFAGLIFIILAGLANLFLHLPALTMAISALAIVIFSIFILVDVQRVVSGGETNYIRATLTIYLDLVNLFVNLLNLLLLLFGQRRD